jgi:3-oxoacyl-[acyl-carrier-protein] synthase III
MDATAATARDSLRRAGLHPRDVDALLVASEAPPLLTGLAAAVHGRLQLRAQAPAIEVGNACVGFLTALWLARTLVIQYPRILIVCVAVPLARR